VIKELQAEQPGCGSLENKLGVVPRFPWRRGLDVRVKS